MRLPRPFMLIVAALITACGSPLEPREMLDVSLDIDRSTLRPGEVAQVTVRATNAGPRGVTIVINSCGFRFVVTTLSGTEVGPHTVICNLDLYQRELAPGESFEFRQEWAGFGRAPWGRTPPALPPGPYFLRGRVGGLEWSATSPRVLIRIEEEVEPDA